MHLSRMATLFLIAVVSFPLLFGGLVHALVPHTHSDNTVITSDMHSAFRHEEQTLLALPVFDSVLVVVVALLLISYRALTLNALVVRERHKMNAALRRGIVLYRRFG